jgi:phage repressor protein C with HTH and peptisase S24 domain
MSDRLIREIQRRMNALDLDAKTTSLKAGLSESFVRDILRKKSIAPKHDSLAKVARVLGCTLADLTGERGPPRPPRPTGDTVSIYELDVHAGSGMGTDGETALLATHEDSAIIGVHTMPAASFREAYGVPSGHIRIIPVRGNSMEPTLWAGQRVMVDIEDKSPSPPGTFVVWDGLGLVLKFVEVVPNSDPLKVRISSANKNFMSYERTLDEAHINGRVVGVWARM